MDRKQAHKLLEAYKEPKMRLGNTVISFARQHKEDIEEIEAMDTAEITGEWKGLYYMNYIMGSVSLNELQRISLLELEMVERKVNGDEISKWIDEAEKEYEQSQERGE